MNDELLPHQISNVGGLFSGQPIESAAPVIGPCPICSSSNVYVEYARRADGLWPGCTNCEATAPLIAWIGLVRAANDHRTRLQEDAGAPSHPDRRSSSAAVIRAVAKIQRSMELNWTVEADGTVTVNGERGIWPSEFQQIKEWFNEQGAAGWPSR